MADAPSNLSQSSGGGTVEVYRLRVARGNDNGGGGKWQLFESRAEFEEAVFNALVESAAHSRRPTTPEKRRAKRWLEQIIRGGKEVGYKEWTTDKVFAAEKLSHGQWIDLGARLVPPSVEFDNDDKPWEDEDPRHFAHRMGDFDA